MAYRYPHVLYPNNELTELLEMYEKLVNEYNSILASVEAIDTKVTELYSYVDEEIKKGLEETILLLSERMDIITNSLLTLSDDISMLESETNARFTTERTITNMSISASANALSITINALEQATNEQIAELWEYMKEIEQTGFKVFNPTTAESSTVERAVNDVWQRLKEQDSFKAREFDASGITIAEFDASGITCGDFDAFGKMILKPRKMFNTFTGLLDSLENVIQSSKFIDTSNAITCGEFDALPITCAEFDALTITAFEFDTKADAIL